MQGAAQDPMAQVKHSAAPPPNRSSRTLPPPPKMSPAAPATLPITSAPKLNRPPAQPGDGRHGLRHRSVTRSSSSPFAGERPPVESVSGRCNGPPAPTCRLPVRLDQLNAGFASDIGPPLLPVIG